MLTLSLFWLLLGIIVGTIANAACFLPEAWNRRPWGWLILPTIGAVAALVGGWIGVLLIGKYLATESALLVGVAGMVVGARLISRSCILIFSRRS